ncbi:MAG: DJ-1/PfpI family protein [Acidobacteriota bacterium]|nr:DJ-1/PfpI family protein [Acidobacteriota bacterium]
MIVLVWLSLALAGTIQAQDTGGRPAINTAFVVIDGVFNSELIAPLDILQHSVYRKQKTYFRTYLVSPDGKPIKTAEGQTIHADYSFADCPKPEVLVIPSTLTSMDKDLEDGPYMRWVRKHVASAVAVITLCDGAFPLGNTGALDGLNATTYPGDQEAFAKKFPKIKVHRDVWFVHHDKYITSVGGAKSYEPALFLAHLWFGQEYAQRLATGLVIDWDLTKIPHKTFGKAPKRPR